MKINSIIDLVKDLDTSRQTKNLNKLLIRILLHLQVEFSIHEVDYLYWLFGKPQCTHHLFTHKSSLGIRAIDYANYLMEYLHFNVNVILNYYRRDYKRTLELVCSDGTFMVDLASNTIICGNKVLFSSTKSIIDTYFSQMEYFIECVSRHRCTMNDMEDANNVLKISLQNDIER